MTAFLKQCKQIRKPANGKLIDELRLLKQRKLSTSFFTATGEVRPITGFEKFYNTFSFFVTKACCTVNIKPLIYNDAKIVDSLLFGRNGPLTR